MVIRLKHNVSLVVSEGIPPDVGERDLGHHVLKGVDKLLHDHILSAQLVVIS